MNKDTYINDKEKINNNFNALEEKKVYNINEEINFRRTNIKEVINELDHQFNFIIDEGKYERYFSIIESLLYVSGDPLEISTVANILECSEEFATEILKLLEKVYEEDESRGIKLIRINGAYQFGTKQINSDHVQMLLKTNVRQSLSRASLETLSIIAYKQPITKLEIEEIRGVKSDRAIYTLVEKGLIKECGKKNVIGRPYLYATTDEFLKYFDFSSLGEMPNLDNFMEDEEDEADELIENDTLEAVGRESSE